MIRVAKQVPPKDYAGKPHVQQHTHHACGTTFEYSHEDLMPTPSGLCLLCPGGGCATPLYVGFIDGKAYLEPIVVPELQLLPALDHDAVSRFKKRVGRAVDKLKSRPADEKGWTRFSERLDEAVESLLRKASQPASVVDLPQPGPPIPAPAQEGWRDKMRKLHVWLLLKRNTAPWTPEDQRFLVLSLCGEVGELANEVKKMWRGDDGADVAKNVERLIAINGEVADVRILLELVAEAFAIDVEAVVEGKVVELRERYPEAGL